MIKTLRIGIILFIFDLAMMPLMCHSEKNEQISFYGALVNEPCSLSPGVTGSDMTVDFGTIPEKNFYLSQSGYAWSAKFSIQLENCDLSIGNQVKLTFNGDEDKEQSGMLALESKSQISHVAIDITTSDGKRIPINTSSDVFSLNSGGVTLSFIAHLKASAAGIIQKNIGNGSFESSATFTLEYL